MRGEDLYRCQADSGFWETPPHAWGRRCKKSCSEDAYGNTPTCVGKTGAIISLKNPFKKHPHMRGEDKLSTLRWVPFRETPPHAWGRQLHVPLGFSRGGNTPTCVGKTEREGIGMKLVKKHPHMRGEDSVSTFIRKCQIETPPHAWGRRKDGKK